MVNTVDENSDKCNLPKVWTGIPPARFIQLYRSRCWGGRSTNRSQDDPLVAWGISSKQLRPQLCTTLLSVSASPARTFRILLASGLQNHCNIIQSAGVQCYAIDALVDFVNCTYFQSKWIANYHQSLCTLPGENDALYCSVLSLSCLPLLHPASSMTASCIATWAVSLLKLLLIGRTLSVSIFISTSLDSDRPLVDIQKEMMQAMK